MNDKGREFQIFAKPAGAKCNLACSYCYYLDRESAGPDTRDARMKPALLEKYIKQHIEATTADHIQFSWHGGEPMLAGLDFFRKVIELQKKYSPEEKKVVNGIQTNGMLINDDWCRFFHDNDFIVGISIDGPSFLHDIYRRTVNDKPTFSRVKESYLLLREYGISTEILCTVNSENVLYPIQVYEFFRALGVEYITFIPVVERLPGGRLADYSVPAEEYGAFLCAVFDQWKARDIGIIKIQIFEEALRTAFRQDHTLCIFKEVCGGVPVLEADGSFYSCDHFVNKDNLVGNISDNNLSVMLDSRKQEEFGEKKLNTLPEYCLQCEVRDMCNGGCPKNRFISTPGGEPGLNYLCPGYKIIFNHIRAFADTVETVWGSKIED